jgi:hypothetical protein
VSSTTRAVNDPDGEVRGATRSTGATGTLDVVGVVGVVVIVDVVVGAEEEGARVVVAAAAVVVVGALDVGVADAVVDSVDVAEGAATRADRAAVPPHRAFAATPNRPGLMVTVTELLARDVTPPIVAVTKTV